MSAGCWWCGHEYDEHADGGACGRPGCDCITWHQPDAEARVHDAAASAPWPPAEIEREVLLAILRAACAERSRLLAQPTSADLAALRRDDPAHSWWLGQVNEECALRFLSRFLDVRGAGDPERDAGCRGAGDPGQDAGAPDATRTAGAGGPGAAGAVELAHEALLAARGYLLDRYADASRCDWRSAPRSVVRLAELVESAIGATLPPGGRHDAGAFARCGRCGRYSADARALDRDRPERCDCGEERWWSGSFAAPGPGARWSTGIVRAVPDRDSSD